MTKQYMIPAIALLAMSMSFLMQLTPLLQNTSIGSSLTICTAYGLQTISIDEDGQKIPSPEQAPQSKRCTTCIIAGMDYQTAPDTTLIRSNIETGSASVQPRSENTVPATINRKALPIRAPPITT
ncbi:MAG: hypothetical protein ACRBCK_07535 [Alphaproteobacteria bacterium]